VGTVNTDYYFLGERTYVHGPTILVSFFAVVDPRGDSIDTDPEIRVVTCRFRRYLRENGTIVWWTAGEEAPEYDSQHLYASATVESRGQTYHFVLLSDGKLSIDRRVPYHENKYLGDFEADREYSGTCSLQGVFTKKDLIRAIVAFNKRIHEDTDRQNPDAESRRWGFSSLDGLLLPGIPAETPKSDAAIETSLRLTSLRVWNVGDNLHSRSEGQLKVPGQRPCTFRLGFTGQAR